MVPGAYELYRLFFSEDMVKCVTEASNVYPDRVAARPRPHWVRAGDPWPRKVTEKARERPMVENDVLRMQAVQIMAGLRGTKSMRDAWGDSWVTGVPEFGKLMSRAEWEFMNSRFSVEPPQDFVVDGDLPPPRCPGESKVQVLLELFRRTLLKYYVPGRDLSYDEATAAYFGRYSPMKHIQPHKPSDGLRVYAVCEAGSAYLSNFYWDCRTGETIEQMMLKTLEPFEGRNHHVYMDNLFTSFKGILALKDRGIFACGTVRRSGRGLPGDFLEDKDLKKKERGFWQFRTDERDVAAFNWLDTGATRIMCSTHSPHASTVLRRVRGSAQRLEVPCPESAKAYNANMGGVDLLDQKREEFSVHLRTPKWWRTMYSFVVDCALHNAHVLYKKICAEYGETAVMDKRAFCTAVVEEICNLSRAQPQPQPRRRRRDYADVPQYPLREDGTVKRKRFTGIPQGDNVCPDLIPVQGDPSHRLTCKLCFHKSATPVRDLDGNLVRDEHGRQKFEKKKHHSQRCTTWCATCLVPLHTRCMAEWHGRNVPE